MPNRFTEQLDALSHIPDHWIKWPMWTELQRVNYSLFEVLRVETTTRYLTPSERWLLLSLIAEMSDHDLNECFGLKAPNPLLFKNPHDHD